MLTNIKLHLNYLSIPGESLAARYNLCQGPVPGRGPALEKHCTKLLHALYSRFIHFVTHQLSVAQTSFDENRYWRERLRYCPFLSLHTSVCCLR